MNHVQVVLIDEQLLVTTATFNYLEDGLSFSESFAYVKRLHTKDLLHLLRERMDLEVDTQILLTNLDPRFDTIESHGVRCALCGAGFEHRTVKALDHVKHEHEDFFEEFVEYDNYTGGLLIPFLTITNAKLRAAPARLPICPGNTPGTALVQVPAQPLCPLPMP